MSKIGSLYKWLPMAVVICLSACNDDDKNNNQSDAVECLELTASTTDIELDGDRLDDVVLTFEWTPAREMPEEYMISYVTKIDIEGSNFNSCVRNDEEEGVFSKSYTTAELQNLLTEKWGQSSNKSATIQFRVIAKWDGGTRWVKPEVRTVSVNVRPYKPIVFDADRVYLDGTAMTGGRITMSKTVENEYQYAFLGDLKQGELEIPVEFEGETNYICPADGEGTLQDGEAENVMMKAEPIAWNIPKAITIAEEVSGMPGLAAKVEDGGYGFDYRMAMNIPDYWIKTIKEKIDEDWKPSSMFWEVTNRRQDEKTISYAESHDQALVGDKTIIFRLIDADMYWHMQKGDENYVVNRGIALHKMIRLLTASTINGGYLNFMGNEFGHPEWIDFPREGNGWSCKYARRQWNLVDNKDLTYHYMGDFDAEMLKVIKSVKNFQATPVQEIWHNDGDQVLAYGRKDLIFVFNFNPKQSFTDYGFLVTPGAYEVILNTDNVSFGGNGLTDDSIVHFTNADPLYKKEKKEWLKLYIPARTAVVLRKKK